MPCMQLHRTVFCVRWHKAVPSNHNNIAHIHTRTLTHSHSGAERRARRVLYIISPISLWRLFLFSCHLFPTLSALFDWPWTTPIRFFSSPLSSDIHSYTLTLMMHLTQSEEVWLPAANSAVHALQWNCREKVEKIEKSREWKWNKKCKTQHTATMQAHTQPKSIRSAAQQMQCNTCVRCVCVCVCVNAAQ